MRKSEQRAYAKINLSLDILGKREDGYHIVRMVMQTVDLYDTLRFETNDCDLEQMKIELTADSDEIPSGDDNLICRAVRLLAETYGLHTDLRISLQKRIPVAAGMAGGSTDAAAALRAARDLFLPSVTDEDLQKLAVRLGADIPYCITGGTQLSEGIGEKLTALRDAPQCGLVLIKPSVSVSTGEAYKAYDGLRDVRHPDIEAQIAAIRAGDFAEMAAHCGNVLELVTGGKYPLIGQIERFMEERGATVSRMSGSGPTVFALFESEETAHEALKAFEREDISQGCRSFCSRFVYRIYGNYVCP